MASGVTVKATGIREVQRGLRKIDADLPRALNRALVEIGRPISEDARSRVERYGSSVANKIRPRVKGSSLFVESRARSKGIRPNLGGLVFRGIYGAAAKHTDKTVEAFERVIERLARDNGFGT